MAAREHKRAAVMIDLNVLQQKLDDARREVRNLLIMQLDPGNSPNKLAPLHDLEQLAHAEVKRRGKALEHAKSQAR